MHSTMRRIMREEAFQAIYILSLRLSPRGRKIGVLLLPHLDICHHHHYICLLMIPVAKGWLASAKLKKNYKDCLDLGATLLK